MRNEESLARVLCKCFRTFSAAVSDSGWNKTSSDTEDHRQTISELQPGAQGVFWVLDLLTDCLEQLTNSDSACAVGNEGWDHSARVGVNGVGCARFDLAIRFEQPSTV